MISLNAKLSQLGEVERQAGRLACQVFLTLHCRVCSKPSLEDYCSWWHHKHPPLSSSILIIALL